MSEPEARPWRPRFGLGFLLLVTFVCSVMATAGYYLAQSLRTGGDMRLPFIIFTVASPLLLLVAVSLLQALFSWLRR